MIDLKAIKARHTAGMDTRQSAHQDREDLLAEVDALISERDHFREAWAAAQARLDCGTDAIEAIRKERAAVVAHLRERAIHGAGNTVTVEDACTILAGLFERGEHLRETA
jgi:hypothetical protein